MASGGFGRAQHGWIRTATWLATFGGWHIVGVLVLVWVNDARGLLCGAFGYSACGCSRRGIREFSDRTFPGRLIRWGIRPRWTYHGPRDTMDVVGLFSIAGVLEGFYGMPWTWAQRRAVMERCIPKGLPWYAWAPKSDPLHRELWREPFPEEHLQGFADLLSIDGLKLCIALAPGLDGADFGDNFADDMAALVGKVEPVIELVEASGTHTPLVMIAFDDLGPKVTNPVRHSQVISALYKTFGKRIHLCVCPVHYAGTVATEYLSVLSDQIPADVLVAWTGPLVVNEAIHGHDARAFSDAVGSRSLLLWDNYPVNDAFLSDQIFLQPMRGRDPLLSEVCTAYFANAGLQPTLSLPPLLSAGAWCEGGVATASWQEFDQPAQLALLADACDGAALYALAETMIAAAAPAATDPASTEPAAIAAVTDGTSQAFMDLRQWLQRLRLLELSGAMGEEGTPWLKQIHTEAKLSLIAMELLECEIGQARVPELIIELLLKWPNVRRSKVSVFGPRFGVRPALGMSAQGVWTAHAPLLIEAHNTTDLLCHAAIARHTEV
jgi:beta-N-acetylglucosaminidase